MITVHADLGPARHFYAALADDLDDMIEEALRATLTAAMRRMQPVTPRRSGDMAKGYRVRAFGDYATLTNTQFYSGWVAHEGTRYMRANPVLAALLDAAEADAPADVEHALEAQLAARGYTRR